ncbi:hypothetical protein G6L28_08270 [Agrobacterium larrymoorei]|uniref:hypothetical protein n=1 Tax=Agrobacterium larrymoorei TaxID=160699 RepID=UPI0015736C26|nr:hypothetical protein [Agrobacterium larrymoorei]NTJ42592.1 hypothetical protein [Agrobacterium larrymoorei]
MAESIVSLMIDCGEQPESMADLQSRAMRNWPIPKIEFVKPHIYPDARRAVTKLREMPILMANYADINVWCRDPRLGMRQAHRWHTSLSIFVPAKPIIFSFRKRIQS